MNRDGLVCNFCNFLQLSVTCCILSYDLIKTIVEFLLHLLIPFSLKMWAERGVLTHDFERQLFEIAFTFSFGQSLNLWVTLYCGDELSFESRFKMVCLKCHSGNITHFDRFLQSKMHGMQKRSFCLFSERVFVLSS